MSACAKVVALGIERADEGLRVLGWLETLEQPLSLAGRQARVLTAVIQTLVPAMLSARQESADDDVVRPTCVGPELCAQQADRLVAYVGSALGEEILNVAKDDREARMWFAPWTGPEQVRLRGDRYARWVALR